MAIKNIELLRAAVGHARLSPKKNVFSYKVFYIKVPITKSEKLAKPVFFSFDRWNIFSLRRKKYTGNTHNKHLCAFIDEQLQAADIKIENEDEIVLITHPRLFGYSFNPISYWLITNKNGELRAVYCAVTNTFKQTHNYLLSKADKTPIRPEDVLIADKALYVSPYTKNEGHYEFSFTYTNHTFKSVINYFDAEGSHILNTYMGGETEILTSKNILQSVASYPFMTIMVVLRIRWQAIRLLIKRVPPTLKTRQKKYTNHETTRSDKFK